MSSQLNTLLRVYCENIINDLPHFSEQLNRIIYLFKASTSNMNEITITKMIAFLFQTSHSGVYQQAKREEAIIDLFEKILELLVPSLDPPILLKFLLNRDFAGFYQYCQKNPYLPTKDIMFRAQGLFPPNDATGKGSIFSFQSQKKMPFEGNPNWLYSRYALSNWYKIMRQDLSDQEQHVYTFLLGQANCFPSRNSLNHLWRILYQIYTQFFLEQHLSTTVTVDQIYITWDKISENQFLEQLIAGQKKVSQQYKVIYYLVCNLLNQVKYVTQNEIKHSFQSFKKFNFKNKQLKLFANTLFLQLSRIQKNLELEQIIKAYGKELIQQETSKGIFFSVYFNMEEIVSKIIEKQVNFLDIPLKNHQKTQIATQMYKNELIKKYQLQYLPNQNFVEMFSSNQWKQESYEGFVLGLMSDNKNLFLEKLMCLAEQTETLIADKQFQLFFDAWNSCYEISQSQNIDINVLQTAVSLKRQQIRKKYQFMVIPRDFPEVVLRILFGYYRFFSNKKSEIRVKGKFQTLLNEFQQKILPELLALLDQDQRSTFWKEWVTVINGDREFVSQILEAADPSLSV